MAYEDSLKYYKDLKNVIDTAEKTGEEKNQLENAKNALLEGLSIEEIQKIADSLKE